MRNLIAKNAKWIALILTAAAINAFTITASAGSDSDIKTAVDHLKQEEIMVGDHNGNLNLDKELTRAELAALMYRIHLLRPDLVPQYIVDVRVPPVKDRDLEPTSDLSNADKIPEYRCDTVEAIEEVLIERLKNRDTLFIVNYPYSLYSQSGALSMLHSAEQKCEDYIRYGRKSSNIQQYVSNNRVICQYSIVYLTTIEKDAAAWVYAAELVEKLNIQNLSDRKKVDVISNYFKENMKYDYSLANKNAHDAFVNKIGTCQGLAMAMHMMLTKAGVESVAVSGWRSTKHIWLMVKIDEYWYRIDATKPYGKGYLEPAIDGGAYTANAEYRTEEFVKAHPVKPANSAA